MLEKRDDFLNEVNNISQSVLEKGECEYDKDKFKEKFFHQSSHSPDNLKSMEYIEYGYIRTEYLENRRTFGLKIKGKDVLLTDITHSLEDGVFSKIIAQEFPELTIDEIEAALRVITIIMRSFECQEMED